MRKKKILIGGLLLTFCFNFLLTGIKVFAAPSFTLEGLKIEGAVINPDISSKGPEKEISFINPDFGPGGIKPVNSISIFTEGNRPWVSDGSIMTNVAVILDKNLVVTKVINKAPAPGVKPPFNESTDVEVPEGGVVLLASDDSYANAGYKKFLAENFKEGDKVKLKKDDSNITISEILELTGQNGPKEARLSLDYTQMYTTSDKIAPVKGKLTNLNKESVYKINVRKIAPEGQVIGDDIIFDINEDGTFSKDISLESGVNYLDVTFVENGTIKEEKTQSMIIFRKDLIKADKDKEIVMWVDQFSNAKNLNTEYKIEKMVKSAKKAGVTALSVDVKGPEGYVSYKKNELSGTPYLTETTNPNKKVEMDIDLLEEIIRIAHLYDIKVYASFNFFTEGNIKTNDSAVIKDHPEWEEVLQAPEDKGALKKVSESEKDSTLVYVNAANKEVQEFQLKRVEEVLKNYEVDGVVMDRARYDNLYSDFSDTSRDLFANYLANEGKTLESWPHDAFKIDADGQMIKGQYYYEWLTFRSNVVKEFTEDLRSLINKYDVKTSKDIKLAAYVGAWYESYYQCGVNWADDSFVYNNRLGLPEAGLYTKDYSQTSYLNDLDFLMIGTYYKSEREIEKYATQGNILTNGEVDLIASIDLTTSVNLPEEQRKGFQAAFDNTDGGMIFDLCYTNWYMLECAIKDIQYEKPNHFSVVNHANNELITVNEVNAARSEDTIVIYTDEHGDTTGTNAYGVEVVVDSTGTVVDIKNKQQAIDWNWSSPQNNDSKIPKGGFVISATDRSGERTLRQLLANGFNIGDKVTAAMITDFVDYKGIVFDTIKANLEFSVQALGSANSLKVLVNGEEANTATKSLSKYSKQVNLENGENIFNIEVVVDGVKTLEKEIVLMADIDENLGEEGGETLEKPEKPEKPEGGEEVNNTVPTTGDNNIILRLVLILLLSLGVTLYSKNRKYV
ncbi:family 10 glycosylhydrolase [Clostridium paraputrificum]|uniref:Glycosyl hydrolase-like 10 domain-containing protein n=1 Tax=Clostridium paraputrificum TaxID=29363 RepID=A0A6N2ZDV6_9CLOT